MSERKEIIKVLAEKVMGWEIHHRNTACYCVASERDTIMTKCCAYVPEFDPFANSADNDALIEAYNTKCKPRDFNISVDSASWYVEAIHLRGDEWVNVCIDFELPYTTAKKNKAVCMAIYEAVTA